MKNKLQTRSWHDVFHHRQAFAGIVKLSTNLDEPIPIWGLDRDDEPAVPWTTALQACSWRTLGMARTEARRHSLEHCRSVSGHPDIPARTRLTPGWWLAVVSRAASWDLARVGPSAGNGPSSSLGTYSRSRRRSYVSGPSKLWRESLKRCNHLLMRKLVGPT